MGGPGVEAVDPLVSEPVPMAQRYVAAKGGIVTVDLEQQVRVLGKTRASGTATITGFIRGVHEGAHSALGYAFLAPGARHYSLR